MKNILVTGGAGFIGSNFVRIVLDEHIDHFVVNLDSLTYAGNIENLAGYMDNANHKFVKGDICDGELVANLIDTHNIDAIVNFAAESHVDRSLTNPGLFIDTNVTGTLTLLKAALDKDVERFVQISTDEVYGSVEKGRSREIDPLMPRSPYAASKAGGELLARSYWTWRIARRSSGSGDTGASGSSSGST